MSAGDNNTYTIKRGLYGGKITFKAKDEIRKNMCIKQDLTLYKNFEPKNPKVFSLTNIPEKGCHIICTEKTKTKSAQFKHVEGGWPESVKDPSENRDVMNWKRQEEKKEAFPGKVKTLIAHTETKVKQNLRMDIYEEYFEENEESLSEDNFSAKVITVYKDIEEYRRSVNKVVWFTEDKETQTKFAISYKLHKDEQISTTTKLPCLVWDINNPNTPTNVLRCNSEIITLAFNTKLSNLLGAGCANGTAVIFDLKESKILAVSRLEESHSEPISDFVWLKSKNGTEFVTTSTDGKVIWWEIKGYNANPPVPITIEPEKPLVLMDKDNEIEKEYGGTKIEYNPEAGPNKFLIGSEQGTIFVANKKKNEADIQNKLGFKWGRHLGPVSGMQRCPAQTKFFLTVGDWTSRIWTEDSKIPVIISKYHPAYLTDCMWSPVRAGIFFISRSDGWLLIYDLCYKINEPAFSLKISESALTSIAINNSGDKLIIGDEAGIVYLLELSESFKSRHDDENKKNFINALFDREALREKAIEVVLKKKQNVGKDESAKILKQEQQIKDKIKKIEAEYLPFVNELLSQSEYRNKQREDQKELENSRKATEPKVEEAKNVNDANQLNSMENIDLANNSQQENPQADQEPNNEDEAVGKEMESKENN